MRRARRLRPRPDGLMWRGNAHAGRYGMATKSAGRMSQRMMWKNASSGCARGDVVTVYSMSLLAVHLCQQCARQCGVNSRAMNNKLCACRACIAAQRAAFGIGHCEFIWVEGSGFSVRISVAIAPRRCIIHLQEQTARRKVAGMADRALKKKRRLEVFAVERKRRFPNLREVR